MATILVFDDHLPTRELLRALFQYKGHRVLLAESGPEAISSAAREGPDLIIADVVMPGMDGFTFLRMLAAHTDCKTTPAILMSASLDEGKARALAGKVGALEYIPKPFDPATLLERVSAVLSQAELCAED